LERKKVGVRWNTHGGGGKRRGGWWQWGGLFNKSVMRKTAAQTKEYRNKTRGAKTKKMLSKIIKPQSTGQRNRKMSKGHRWEKKELGTKKREKKVGWGRKKKDSHKARADAKRGGGGRYRLVRGAKKQNRQKKR